MLAQPLFLILDALLDERTQLYMTVKSWLNNMIGIDRLFLLIVIKMSELPCIRGIRLSDTEPREGPDREFIVFTEDDDLDLCLYYLRTLYHVLSCSKEASLAVLASKKIRLGEKQQIQILGGDEDGITFQDYFVRVCMTCITGDASTTGSTELRSRVTQLHRYSLTILHHFLLSHYAAPLSKLNLDVILLDRLLQSISSPDPYVQVLMLDVIFDALKLRDASTAERTDKSEFEKRRSSVAELARASQPSIPASDFRSPVMTMPPQLLKCLQAGLSSSSSHQIDGTFSNLKHLFRDQAYHGSRETGAPESTLIYLLNALEQVLARAHDQILAEEARAQLMKGPDQPQSLFGSMVSGVFQSDAPQTRSATANDRLTVHLAIQDAVRICFKIWSWGQGKEATRQDASSSASFNYTSLQSRKMRRELGDIFLRLLTAIFTTRPTFAEPSSNGSSVSKPKNGADRQEIWANAVERSEDVVTILASIIPNFTKILLEPDRVLSAAGTISTNVVGPILRSKAFPNSIPPKFMSLLNELSRLQNNQKSWKKDISDAFGDNKFFSTNLALVKDDWLPLLRQWTLADKERLPEVLSRISSPTTAGIVFGVGATSARLEADRKTQLSLRRIATLILASAENHFVTDIPAIFDKLVDLLSATSTSSPSSVTRAEVYMVVRALVLKTSPVHLAMVWPVINAEVHAAISSVVAPDHSAASEMYVNAAILQACKLLDLLICLAPDDFQLHEWLFVTDTIDAVYHSSTFQPVALIDEISEELGSAAGGLGPHHDDLSGQPAASSAHFRRPLLRPGGINDEVSLERKDELVAKILRPFFGQLSIYAFESTYAMGTVDREACIQGLLKDIFDDRSMVKAL
ncbi:Protein dopey [Escovopsis weberi]|uniref:Protein dopey n=1 Tax=Escovopsis weberi TaxID=150374 RepID=A0A0M8N4A4_ESCWE|nr:Protein dopey [Escovopsis weberi]